LKISNDRYFITTNGRLPIDKVLKHKNHLQKAGNYIYLRENEVMSKLMKIFSPVGALADRIICVFLAVLFAQGPTYIAQYMDVLSGAEMEARNTYENVENRANQRGLSVGEYVDKTIEETPRGIEAWDFVQDTKNTVDRYERYSKALTALKNSSLWKRPWVLATHFDQAIHKAIQFEPNVPITQEGAVYGLVGVVIALILIALVRGLFNLIFGKKKQKLKTKA